MFEKIKTLVNKNHSHYIIHKPCINKTINLWLTAPKGDVSVNQTPENDWQMAVRRDNKISIMLRTFRFVLLNEVITQLSSRGRVDFVPEQIHI